jgi:hypothetical protein
MHFGVMLLAAVMTSSLPLPWQVGSFLFLVAAMVVGVRALVSVWRVGLRGALVPLLALGLVFTGLLSLSMLSLLALWPVQMERQNCLRDALTIAAEERCEVTFRTTVEERLLEMSAVGSAGSGGVG